MIKTNKRQLNILAIILFVALLCILWLVSLGVYWIVPRDPAGIKSLRNASASGSIQDISNALRHPEVNIDIEITIYTGAPEWSRTLHMATDRSDADIVLWLLESGADPNLLDAHGRTSLYRVCEMPVTPARILCMNHLLDNGADPDGVPLLSIDCTPLMRASFNQCPDYVGLLLESGADPNCTNSNADSPLHCLFSTNRSSNSTPNQRACLALLLAYDADLTIENRAGVQPFEIAPLDLVAELKVNADSGQ